MTRKERDNEIVAKFEQHLANGLSKTEATRLVREEFKFLTDVPIYSARRRVKERKEAENGK